MDLEVLPLAVAMTAGPPMVAAVLLLTGPQPVKTSFAFLTGALLAGVAGVMLAMVASGAFDALGELQPDGETSTAALWLQVGLIGVLAAMAIKTIVTRHDSEMPKWLDRLQTIGPAGAFKTALLIYGLLPTKVVTMMVVGVNLAAGDYPLSAAWPFWSLSLAILSLPLAGFTLFRSRAEGAMPRFRDKLAANSWAVKLFVYALFTWLILK